MENKINQTREEQRKARVRALVEEFFQEHWRGRMIEIEDYVLGRAKNYPLLDKLSVLEIEQIPGKMREELKYDSAIMSYVLKDSRFLERNRRKC